LNAIKSKAKLAGGNAKRGCTGVGGESKRGDKHKSVNKGRSLSLTPKKRRGGRVNCGV